MTHLAVLPYSSGTTGAPKGVMLTHHNLTSNVRQTLGSGLIDGYSVMVDFLPFFHIYGMAVLLLPGLAAGATQITMPAFEPDALPRDRRGAPGDEPVHGAARAARARQLRRRPTALERAYIMSGAAPLPLDVARRVAERFDVTVVQGYGMTEASPVTHISLLGRRQGGHGRPAGRRHPPEGGRPRDRRDAARRRDRRAARERPAGDGGLLRPARRDRGVDRRGRRGPLAAHRRHRVDGRGRLRHHPRPRQGDDQVQGVPDRAGRAGERDHGAPRRRRRRGHPEGQRHRRRRVPEGVRRACAPARSSTPTR